MFFKPYIPNLENEVDQAEALEVYTRWVQGEKLPGKNHKYLQALAKEDERSVSWILDKMIDYFREKGSPSDTVKKIHK